MIQFNHCGATTMILFSHLLWTDNGIIVLLYYLLFKEFVLNMRLSISFYMFSFNRQFDKFSQIVAMDVRFLRFGLLRSCNFLKNWEIQHRMTGCFSITLKIWLRLLPFVFTCIQLHSLAITSVHLHSLMFSCIDFLLH